MSCRLFLFLIFAALLGACGGGSSDSETADAAYEHGAATEPDPTFDQGVLAFVHTLSDSPEVDIALNSTNSGESALTVGFGQIQFQYPTVAGIDVGISYLDANEAEVDLFSREEKDNIKLFRDDEVIVWMTGNLDSPEVILVENKEYRFGIDPEDYGTVKPQLQLFHGAIGEGALDIYLSPAGSNFDESVPITTLSHTQHSIVFEIDPGKRQRLRVTPAGVRGSVLYDSGEFDITNDERWHIFFMDYFGPGGTRVVARAVRNGATTSFANEKIETALNLVNLVADSNFLDLHINSTNVVPTVQTVRFGEIRGVVGEDLEPATSFVVTVDGVSADVAASISGSLETGSDNFVVVAGLFRGQNGDSTPNIASQEYSIDLRRIATGISVEFFHGSPEIAGVDFYLLPVGQSITDQPTFTLTFGNTGRRYFREGDYDLEIRISGSSVSELGPQRVRIDADHHYQFFLTDTAGGGPPIDVLMISTPVR